MNMSYCRFENTQRALRECNNSLEDESFESLSASEKEAALSMVEIAEEFLRLMDDNTGGR